MIAEWMHALYGAVRVERLSPPVGSRLFAYATAGLYSGIAATRNDLPSLEGKLNGISIRVPTPNVSLVDLVFRSAKPVSVQAINDALKRAAAGPMKNILAVSEEPIVSSDLVGNPHSSIADLPLTMVMGDRMAKVFSWYDNEWGFSNRMVDLAVRVGELG